MLMPEGVEKDVLLSEYAAYGVGGKADYFYKTQNEAQLLKVLEWARDSKIPYFILGSGTNLLIRDGGYRGLVLYLGPKVPSKIQVPVTSSPSPGTFRVPAWFAKASLLDFALENGFEGLEFSAGIPGTLGGAVYMNAGTRWGSYASVIRSVRIWYPNQGIVERSAEEMGFRYRGHGETSLPQGSVVVSVDIVLNKTLDGAARSRALVDRILAYRGARQALERPNCGSVFKNPEDSPLGAGRLIEASGLKGYRIGQAQVSTKHANFILNLGGASAYDIESLILHVQSEVLRQKQIKLEPEVIFVGE
jgi:UDP-N-acetylmuramate dehydrogenase